VADQSNAWNQAAAPVAFNVGSETTPASNLVVTAASSNPALVPIGNLILSGAGSNRFLTIIPVANQFGGTTITLTVADGALAATNLFLATFYQTNLVPSLDAGPDSITLANPSFEWGYNPIGVHAHAGVPFGWTPSVNQIGINDTNGPFWDNGGAVDGSYVGYIQGVAADAGALAQANSGFAIGATYWIQFFANSRQSNSITPISSATTARLAVIETASTVGATALVTNLNIPYADVAGTAGGGQPFLFVNIPFVAAASDGVLTIEKTSAIPAGRSAVLLDGFSIIRRTTNDIVVANPSFEASGTNQPVPGYLETVAGWTKLGGGQLAINQAGGEFADNGLLPDGQSVLVLQSSLTEPVGLSQVLRGFTPGATYRLLLALNGRALDPLNGYTNQALVTIGGQTAFSGPVPPVDFANVHTNAFLFVNFDFIAPGTEVTLQIENQAVGGGSLLVDNVRVLMPFSVSITPHPAGLEIVWPVGHLQSATNVSGPWQNEPDAVSPWLETPSGAMKFYRAVLP
jgi:hypothetical protein